MVLSHQIRRAPPVFTAHAAGLAGASLLGRSFLLELERQLCDSSCDVKTVLAFDRDRLQGDRLLESADQDIGARADSECDARRSSAVMAGQRALACGLRKIYQDARAMAERVEVAGLKI